MIAIPQFRIVNRRVVLPPDLALDLQFAADKTLTARVGPTPSFSRASGGTYFDSAGVLQTAATNVPRFDHRLEGGVWVSKGLLIEDDSANKLSRSEEFNDASWVKTGGAITANDTTAPDGTTTADKFVETTANSQRVLNKTDNVGTGIYYCYSVFVKAIPGSAQRYVALGMGSAGFSPAGLAFFNPNTGQVTSTSNVSGTFVQDCGNGWYRIAVIDLATANASPVNFSIYITNSSNSGAAYTGDGSSGVYVWGAQLEGVRALIPSSYIKTVSTGDVVRAADVCRITGAAFTNMWNAASGTLYGAFSIPVNVVSTYSSGFPRIVLAQSSTALPNYESCSIALSSTAINAGVQRNGINQALFALSSPTVNVRCNAALSFAANNFAFCKDGGTVLSDLTGSMPIGVNVMDIGYDSMVANRYLKSHIAAIRYYNSNLTGAQLQALTT